MICANCRQDDCPSPTARHTYAPCGNGCQVSTTVPNTIAFDWEERAQVAYATIEHLKETVKVLSEGLAKWRPVAEAATAEVDRLRNAARSRLKCPNGHGPSHSRGPCWYCDAERNASRLAEAEAALADVRELVRKGWFAPEHDAICRSMFGPCCCGARLQEPYRAQARQLLGLEPKP